MKCTSRSTYEILKQSVIFYCFLPNSISCVFSPFFLNSWITLSSWKYVHKEHLSWNVAICAKSVQFDVCAFREISHISWNLRISVSTPQNCVTSGDDWRIYSRVLKYSCYNIAEILLGDKSLFFLFSIFFSLIKVIQRVCRCKTWTLYSKNACMLYIFYFFSNRKYSSLKSYTLMSWWFFKTLPRVLAVSFDAPSRHYSCNIVLIIFTMSRLLAFLSLIMILLYDIILVFTHAKKNWK